jgi:hypothetical protein
MSVGASFTTNGTPTDLQFSYTSNAFQTGSESLTFTVTDSAASSKTATFSFTVLPQAPFATSVMAQWASTAGNKLDCRTCHGDVNNTTARNRFDLTVNASSVYNELVNGTIGSVKVNKSVPDNSLILCYPSASGACGAGHNGNTGGVVALPSSSPSYGVIKRWIQEGAQDN